MNPRDVDAVLQRLDAFDRTGGRIIVAVAGPPGSGKSTLAARIVAAINDRDGLGTAALVPMDGYHRDNAELDAMGLRAVKGAPDTFDAAGFVDLVRRVREGAADLRYPTFDRARDCTVPDAAHLPRATPVVVFEGNYLLLRDGAWADLKPLFDLTVMLSVPVDVLRERLVQRWLDHGLSRPDAEARAMGNDIPNAETVIARSAAPDLTLVNTSDDETPHRPQARDHG